MTNAIVIGGGPAGLIYAETLVRYGHDVIVFEEHSEIGYPDHCAGLLSITGLNRIRIKPPNKTIQNIVYGAKIYSAKGYPIEIRTKEPKAYVLNRAKFDKFLAEQAEKKGVQINLNTKVLNINRFKSKFSGISYRKNNEIKEINADLIINTEGAYGRIAKKLGIDTVSDQNKIPAIQYEMENVDVDRNVVELYFNNKIANGLFAWIIPTGKTTARVGLASKIRPAKSLAWFVNKSVFKDRFKNARKIRQFGGIIPITLPIKDLVIQNLINIGDVAGQVKATTGGGVIMNGLAARIAAQVSHEYFIHEQKLKTLKMYPKIWRKYVGLDLWLMYRARKVLDNINNPTLDNLFKIIKYAGIIKDIEAKGDMDFQRDAILSVIKSPKIVFSLITPIIRSFL